MGRWMRLVWVLVALAVGSAYGQEAVPAFDVATIRPSKATDGHNHIYKHTESGEFVGLNVSLKMLMQFAYDLPATRIVGGSGWMDSAMWDVQAKCGQEVDGQIAKMDSDAATAQKRQMVRALLAERFGLKVHEEKRELPIYSLVAAKGGAKLGVVQDNGTTINRGRDHLEVQGGDSVGLLAEQLALVLGRVVVNQTGLTGRYNLKLSWAPEDRPAGAESSLPSIFTALEEQLGLRLEAKKGMVGVLAVDSVGMPTAN